ncbi:Chromosome partition protein mukF [Salmonella enterica subsp. enterica serovar Heidelberg]|nr:Chromosome partition protein mukF [Salmonella enterica subsp. enterica serovar Heidelberg]
MSSPSGCASPCRLIFDDPWALTYANADRLLDMRDEEMALRDDEVTGELPPDLEYEEFNEIREQFSGHH